MTFTASETGKQCDFNARRTSKSWENLNVEIFLSSLPRCWDWKIEREGKSASLTSKLRIVKWNYWNVIEFYDILPHHIYPSSEFIFSTLHPSRPSDSLALSTQFGFHNMFTRRSSLSPKWYSRVNRQKEFPLMSSHSSGIHSLHEPCVLVDEPRFTQHISGSIFQLVFMVGLVLNDDDRRERGNREEKNLIKLQITWHIGLCFRGW